MKSEIEDKCNFSITIPLFYELSRYRLFHLTFLIVNSAAHIEPDKYSIKQKEIKEKEENIQNVLRTWE